MNAVIRKVQEIFVYATYPSRKTISRSKVDFSAALSADRFVEAGEFVHVDPLVEGVGHTHLLTIHPSLAISGKVSLTSVSNMGVFLPSFLSSETVSQIILVGRLCTRSKFQV